MTRPYIKTGAARRQIIEEWYRARRALGTQKELAARIGLSEARVQQIVSEIRDADIAAAQHARSQKDLFTIDSG